MTTEASHEIIPIPPVGATATGLLTTTSMPGIEASADARAGGGELVQSLHPALLRHRLEGLHQRELREQVRRPPGSSGRCRPLPISPGGERGQDNGHRAHALGGDRRGPPAGRTPRPDITIAGGGHAEAVGP